MSNIDLPLQLHFALFKGSTGYVIKPPEMMPAASNTSSLGLQNRARSEGQSTSARATTTVSADNAHKTSITRAIEADDQTFWPRQRELLHLTTIEVISLHRYPKVRRSPLFA